MQPAEHELPQLLAADLDRNFPALVACFQQRLFGFALRLTSSRSDAEDIAQEAFISAYNMLEMYPTPRIRALSLQAWLYKIVLHVYQHQLRRARLHLVPLQSTEATAADEIEDCAADQPEAWAEQNEQQQELFALVAQLPERYRVAVTCYYFEQLSYQEIADLLDQPLGTVKSTIHRGVRQLRALLLAQTTQRKEQ